MTQIKVKGNVIKEKIWTNEPRTGFKTVPDLFDGQVGESLDGFDSEFNRISKPVPEPTEKERRLNTLAEQLNDELRFLQETDWYITRKIETGKDCPDEIMKQRQEARDKISSLKPEYERLV